MAFPFQIDILNIMVKGIIIGALASAPMGPVGILCVQRALNKGRWYGFVTGIGAAVSDIIYAMIIRLDNDFKQEILNKQFLKLLKGFIHNSFILHIYNKRTSTKNLYRKSEKVMNNRTRFPSVKTRC